MNKIKNWSWLTSEEKENGVKIKCWIKQEHLIRWFTSHEQAFPQYNSQ